MNEDLELKLPVDIDQILDGVTLEEAWYRMKITSIEKAPNRKSKDGLSMEEGAGENVVVELRLKSDNPEIDGRAFTKWLPWPNEYDETARMPRTGQLKRDWKMENLAAWDSAFNGRKAEGKNFCLKVNTEAYVMLSKQKVDGKEINTISMNAYPRALGDMEQNSSVDDIFEEPKKVKGKK